MFCATSVSSRTARKNAMRRPGVNEGYPGPARTVARRLVDQLDALGFQLRKSCVDVVDPDRDVVQALTVLLQELGDRALRTGRLQQLDLRVAHGQERRFQFLLRHLFCAMWLNTQRRPPE